MELLIAASIFSAVSLAIYTTFSSGLIIFNRVKNVDIARQRVLLKAERLAQELIQQQPCRKPLFFGTKTRISFASLKDYAPCRISYYFDASNSSIMRAVEEFTQVITAEGKVNPEINLGKGSVFLSNVQEVKFAYLYLSLTQNDYIWANEWEYDYLPSAVKITITCEDKEYEKTVLL